MVVSNTALDALKGIGLNLYERKIYVSLLAKGLATAGEVSSIAKVPRSRSYDILESLAEKGFVVAQSSKPIKYIALEPKDALERVQQNMERKHKDMQERVTKFSNSPIVQELENAYKQGFSLVLPFEMTGMIKGKVAVNQQLRSMIKKAKDKITVVTTKQGLSDLHSSQYNILKKAAKRGVKIKVFAPLDKGSPDFSGVADVKHVDQATGRIVTIDNENVMMALTDDTKVHESQDIAFWAQSQHVAKDVMEPMINAVVRK